MATEVSLTVEETNALRAKLGLKPLKTTTTKVERNEITKQRDERARSTRPEDVEDVKEKLLAIREERLGTSAAASAASGAGAGAGGATSGGTQTLGGKHTEEDDDLKLWVQKSRTLEKEKKRALKTQQALQEQEEFDQGEGGGDGGDGSDSGDGGGGGGYTSKNLKGLKIGHQVNQFREGSQVILTLKDQGVLDDRGELQSGEDVLEDTLLAQQEKHEEAKRLAKPENKYEEGEEETQENGDKVVLAKYDEPKKESNFMEIDGSGQVDEAKVQEQNELRKKLKQGIHYGRKKESADPMKRALDDFWTPEEVASMEKTRGKKKKRKKKNLRMKRKDIDELEALAQADGGVGGIHHGKRVEGMRSKQSKESYLNEQAKRDAAYSKALGKAEEKTAEMRAAAQNEAFQDEEEDEFFSALNRARSNALTQQRKADMNRALQVQSLSKGEELPSTIYKGEVFTEAGEFCNSISVKGSRSTPAHESDTAEAELTQQQQPLPQEMETEEPPGVPSSEKASVPADGRNVLGEARIDKGIGAALRLLQDRGELRKTVRWSGRTNEMKDNSVRDVIESYSDQTQFAQDIESALTRKDEFGRVMTPKESFRQFCYKFHGIKTSKNKQEKRIRKYKEEQKLLNKFNDKT